ncbi:hypothetical protein FRC02_001117 [Tulasnella sp. 418]|nr:hypothetical protein FRC02_001117 [Tulasnella sp. 418]
MTVDSTACRSSPEETAIMIEELAGSLRVFQLSALDIAEQAILRVCAFNAWLAAGETDQELRPQNIDSLNAQLDAHRKLLAFHQREIEMLKMLIGHLAIIKQLFQSLVDCVPLGENLTAAFLMAWIVVTSAEELKNAFDDEHRASANHAFTDAIIHDVREFRHIENPKETESGPCAAFDEVYRELFNHLSQYINHAEDPTTRQLESRQVDFWGLMDIVARQLPDMSQEILRVGQNLGGINTSNAMESKLETSPMAIDQPCSDSDTNLSSGYTTPTHSLFEFDGSPVSHGLGSSGTATPASCLEPDDENSNPPHGDPFSIPPLVESYAITGLDIVFEEGFQLGESNCQMGRRHATTHTCNICGVIVNRPSALRVHMRSHDVLRPYACQYCGQSFTKRANLKRHEETSRRCIIGRRNLSHTSASNSSEVSAPGTSSIAPVSRTAPAVEEILSQLDGFEDLELTSRDRH